MPDRAPGENVPDLHTATSIHQHTPVREAADTQCWRPRGEQELECSHTAMREGSLATSYEDEPSLIVHSKAFIDIDPADLKNFIFINLA